MIYRDDQAERSAAAGRSRVFAGSVPVSAAAAVATWGRGWTMPSIVAPTTKRHALNPARRPEEAVSP